MILFMTSFAPALDRSFRMGWDWIGQLFSFFLFFFFLFFLFLFFFFIYK